MSSFGSTQADRELLAKLAEQVQIEVVDPMDAHNWAHGTPPPLAPKSDNPADAPAPNTPAPAARADNPPATVQPKGEAVADTSSDAIDWESMRDPKTGLYAGKYTSRAEMVKGMGNVVNMAKSTQERNAALEKELQALRAAPPAASPVALPATALVTSTAPSASLAEPAVKSEKLATVLAKLVEEGGLIDEANLEALIAGISDQSAIVAANAVKKQREAEKQSADAENEKWNAVQQHMERTAPRALLFVDEMALFVGANPILAKAVDALSSKGDLIGATELAWDAFSRTLPPAGSTAEEQAARQKELELAASETARKEAVDKARREAGLPSTSAGGVHQTPELGASADEVAAAAREMNATGIGYRWRSLTIGKDLTGPWFE